MTIYRFEKECNKGHESIGYDGKKCPICSLIDFHNDRSYKLRKGISDMKAELDNVRDKLSELGSAE